MIKKIGLSALRFLGFNRPSPTTRLGRTLRRVERVAFGLLTLYFLLLARPQMLFAHSVATAQGITFYSRAPLPADAVAACAARAGALVRQSELAVAGRPERVFVCDSPWLFGLFSPMSLRAFAFSTPVTDNVFIATVDFPRDEARSLAPAHNVRSLSGVVAHEITHGLIRHRLGLVRGVLLPAWAAEAYCDYVAREGSFPEREGLRLLAAGQEDSSVSFRYFVDRQMVCYLLETEHGTFADVVAQAHDARAVEGETRFALRDKVTLEPRPSQLP